MEKERINFYFLEITDADNITITTVEINGHEAMLIAEAMTEFTTNGYGGITMNFKIKSTILIPEYILKRIRNEN